MINRASDLKAAIATFAHRAPQKRRASGLIVGSLCLATSAMAVFGSASSADALNWENPNVVLSFVADDRCIAGEFENAAATTISASWTAFNDDAGPGRALDLIYWDGATIQAAGGFQNAPVGQLPQQVTSVNIQTSDLTNNRAYVGLRDTWKNGDIWSDTQAPNLSPNVTAPANGNSGYEFLDMTADPDCVAPEFAASSDPGGTVANNGTVAIGTVPVGEADSVSFTITNTAGGILELETPTTSLASNVTVSPLSALSSSSLTPNQTATFSSAFTPTHPGDFSYRISIPNNDTTQSPFVVTVSGTAADVTPPRVTSITRTAPTVTSPTNSDTLNWLVSYNEAVTGVLASSFAISGTTAMLTVSAVDSSNYTVTASGGDLVTLTDTVTLSHSLDQAIEDLAGNALTNTVPTGTNTNTFVLDNTPPTATLGTLTGPVNGTFTTQITLSEPSTDFAAGDLTLVNATATLTGSGSNYSAVLTPQADGLVSVRVAADSFSDAVGNQNTASDTVSATFDTTAPTATISDVPALSAAPFTARVTFSEAVTGFEADEIVLGNATGSNFTAVSTSVYTVLVTPTADGQVTVDVAAGVAQDNAGNDNTVAPQAVSAFDGTAPTATISDVPALSAAPFTARVTFSEAVTGFEAGEIVLGNATGSNFTAVSSSVYTILVTPTADGQVTIDVAAGVAQDSAGNDNTIAPQAVSAFDGTAPTAEIGTIAGPVSGIYTVAITLSEASTTFAQEDLVLANATAVLTGSGSSYSVELTPLADGLVSVQVGANTFSDAAGNVNTAASNTASITHDGTAPTVEITGLPDDFVATATFTVTVSFNEAVTGFGTEGLSVTNGTVVSIAGGAMVYQATIRASGSGDVVLQVPAGQAFDAGGNANMASAAVSVRNRTVEETQAQIGRFMLSRANSLVSNQPNLICMMSGTCATGGFNLSTNEGGLRFSMSTMSKAGDNGLTVWTRMIGSRSDEAEASADYLFGAVGLHRPLGENAILGGMFQFDHIGRTDGAGRLEGSGWLVGPYAVIRSAEYPLYLEGRVLWGHTSNTIDPFGTYEDRFKTERMLASLTLAGEMVRGDMTFTPSLSATHTTDKQRLYVDTLGSTIPEQDVALSQLRVGLDFRRPLTLGGQMWMLNGGVSGIQSSTKGSALVAAGEPTFEGGRAQIELGLSTTTRSGGAFNIGGFYDGIGAAGFEAYGLDIGFSSRF